MLLFHLFFLSFFSFLYNDTDDVIWVDHFNDYSIKQMPENWHGRKDAAAKYYKVMPEDEHSNNQILCAIAENTDMFILKKIKVDIVKYPYLNWRWRANILPPNGDESKKKVCDVAASMNVVLKASKWRPRSIKYSWSTTLPKFTKTKSPYAFWPARTDIVVLQSGEEHKGQWITEKVNVLEDYKRFYKKKKKPKSFVIEAIVIMSDSDNTNSVAAADYDDIYFSRK